MSYPNQMTGTLLTDFPFDAKEGGGWQKVYTGGQIVTDATAPESPSNVLQYQWVNHSSADVSNTYYVFPTGVNEFWIGFNWWCNSGFRGWSTVDGQKILLLENSHTYFQLYRKSGSGASSVYGIRCAPDLSNDNGHISGTLGGTTFFPNVNATTVPQGAWNTFEWYVKSSSTNTSRDGVLRWWLNNVLQGNYTNVNFNTRTFGTLMITPVWDSTDTANLGFTDTWKVDHARIIRTSGGGGGGSPTGSLQGNRTTPSIPTNLSAEGVTDWVHWGLGSGTTVNRRVSGNRIGSLTTLGGTPNWYNDNPTTYTWSNGTPTATQSGTTTGVYIGGLNNGFQFTAPADTTQRTLKVYAGCWDTSMTLNATLSDGSASAFTDATLVGSPVTGGTNAVWTLTYRAGTANQSLTTTVTANSGSGNVQLQAAALTVQGDTLTIPTISSFSPSNGLVGAPVVITGTNFDPLTINNTVKFNGTTASVSSASTTSLTVTVPAGATTGTITVTTPGGTATSGSSFTVDTSTPGPTPPTLGVGGSAMMILMMP